MQTVNLPAILDIPDKLIPIVTEFNMYTFFELEGGRVSGKSHSVARLLLYVADLVPDLRIFCGREIQNSIEESVYTLFVKIIKENNLNYNIGAKDIDHKTNGSMIRFKGFREQGSVNIKGLESVDILWVDEAQQLKKDTIDIIVPTVIRNPNAKLFFTLNRTLKEDPIHMDMKDRKNCLSIHIDYLDNKHCSQAAKEEAETCKAKNEDDYRHIWLGEPRDSASNAAFRNVEHIVNKALPIQQEPIAGVVYTLGADLARSIDFTVICVIDSRNKQLVYFERIENENKTSWNYQKEKIAAVSRKYNNAVSVIDSTGVGDPIVEDLERMGVNVWYSQRPDSDKSTPGVKFTNLSKENLIDKLKVAIETRLIQIPFIKVLIDELIDYRAILLPSGRYRYSCPNEVDLNGQPKHDDCVIALALALWGSYDVMYAPEYKEPKPETSNDRFWKKVSDDIKKIKNNSDSSLQLDTDGYSIDEGDSINI